LSPGVIGDSPATVVTRTSPVLAAPAGATAVAFNSDSSLNDSAVVVEIAAEFGVDLLL